MSSRTHVPRIYHELQERGDGVAIRGGALMVSLNDVPQERGAPLSKEAQCTSEAAHQASEVESREGLRNPSYTADSLRARLTILVALPAKGGVLYGVDGPHEGFSNPFLVVDGALQGAVT